MAHTPPNSSLKFIAFMHEILHESGKWKNQREKMFKVWNFGVQVIFKNSLVETLSNPRVYENVPAK